MEDEIASFKEDFLEYWDYVKYAVDDDGWVNSLKVPYLLDVYFTANTEKEIEYDSIYIYEDGERGYRWRPESIPYNKAKAKWIHERYFRSSPIGNYITKEGYLEKYGKPQE